MNKISATRISVPEELPYQVTPTTLSLHEEMFVQIVAIEGDAPDAYRRAFPGVIKGASRLAQNLLGRVTIRTRLREHQEAISKIPSAKSADRLIYELEEMCDADPNELIRVERRPCLGCWPFEQRHEEPNESCIACEGNGESKVFLADTTKVSPGARRLFKGVELDQGGGIKKLILHDQMAARIELHKIKGLHIERSLNVNVNRNLPAVKDIVKDPLVMEQYLESLK
jgi:hypothetical protein